MRKGGGGEGVVVCQDASSGEQVHACVLEPRQFSISDVGSLEQRAFPDLGCTVYIFISSVQCNLVLRVIGGNCYFPVYLLSSHVRVGKYHHDKRYDFWERLANLRLEFMIFYLHDISKVVRSALVKGGVQFQHLATLISPVRFTEVN